MKRYVLAYLLACSTIIPLLDQAPALVAAETGGVHAQAVLQQANNHVEQQHHIFASRPEECVNRLHEALIKAMKLGGEVPCSRRYAVLEPVIKDLFDFPLTSRLVLGRYWKGLDQEKRRKFVNAFATMSTATYADRFREYSGEKFKTVDTIMIKKHRALVKTLLITSKGEEIPLDYSCVLSGNTWKIVTVTAKGVNDLAIKRAEYTNFLKDRSIDQLISFLEEQAQRCAGTQS